MPEKNCACHRPTPSNAVKCLGENHLSICWVPWQWFLPQIHWEKRDAAWKSARIHKRLRQKPINRRVAMTIACHANYDKSGVSTSTLSRVKTILVRCVYILGVWSTDRKTAVAKHTGTSTIARFLGLQSTYSWLSLQLTPLGLLRTSTSPTNFDAELHFQSKNGYQSYLVLSSKVLLYCQGIRAGPAKPLPERLTGHARSIYAFGRQL